jgi:hypothetical protein
LAEFKKIGAVIASVGAAIGGTIAVIVNVAPAVHIPAPEVAILVAVSSIAASIVKFLGGVGVATVRASRAAKAGTHVAP